MSHQHQPLSASKRCRVCGTVVTSKHSSCSTCGAPLTPLSQSSMQQVSGETTRGQQTLAPTEFPISGSNRGAPSLAVEVNTNGWKSIFVLNKPLISIGRHSSNDIEIPAPVISRFHAQIVCRDNQLILLHPHPSQSYTTNGLIYQGRHIQGNEPFCKPLVHGDIFHIGGRQGILVTLIYYGGSGAVHIGALDIRPLPSGLSASISRLQLRYSQIPPPLSQPLSRPTQQTQLSEIGLLPTVKRDGLCYWTLPPGKTSRPGTHHSIEEIWCFLEGQGQVWLQQTASGEEVDVFPGVCLTIPPKTHFQLRNTGSKPLCFLITTRPPWPGAQEWVKIEDHWPTQ